MREYDLNQIKKKIPSEEDRHILRNYKETMMAVGGNQKMTVQEVVMAMQLKSMEQKETQTEQRLDDYVSGQHSV